MQIGTIVNAQEKSIVDHHFYETPETHSIKCNIEVKINHRTQSELCPLKKARNWELREFFNYATPLVIMLSLYMLQFTMLFTRSS